MNALSLSPNGLTARRLPGASLFLGALAIAVCFIPGAVSWLQFDRTGVANGQLWRFLTCHWTHFSADHLLWDVAVFVALGTLCERASRRRFWACLIASSILISLTVWLGLPEIGIYRGLSGIDSALFALLALGMSQTARRERNWVWLVAIALAAAGFLGKLAFEVVTDRALFVDSSAAGMKVVPLAHVAGLVAGILAGAAKMTDFRSFVTWLAARMAPTPPKWQVLAIASPRPALPTSLFQKPGVQ